MNTYYNTEWPGIDSIFIHGIDCFLDLTYKKKAESVSEFIVYTTVHF